MQNCKTINFGCLSYLVCGTCHGNPGKPIQYLVKSYEINKSYDKWNWMVQGRNDFILNVFFLNVSLPYDMQRTLNTTITMQKTLKCDIFSRAKFT